VRRVPISLRIAALIAVAVLSLPAVAMAQTQTQPMPSDEPGSSQPPVDLSSDENGGSGETGSESASSSASLPNTGSDPRMLILAGFAITLLGVGLRLRTADADLY
jgi:LPXTG-motif cell wall-anchored protein